MSRRSMVMVFKPVLASGERGFASQSCLLCMTLANSLESLSVTNQPGRTGNRPFGRWDNLGYGSIMQGTSAVEGA
jgi:hypothetical protein